MTLSKLRIAALAAIFAIFFAVLGAGAALAVQEHMSNARNDLNSALNQLNLAQPDKGGHRANAINYTKQAIDEVTAGIQAAR
jgi:hypothetical protein